ncbi:MAG: CoA transferase [Acidimicrobiaceae bacterium]|nr:CoA transferase [Acidimicrobiaceae bacterium]MYE09951.1 CoA transferase [Acidimicrobiaceae bacterium]MYH93275.1 CoA transferase [Acidimicrobiaceae bacterium]MYI36945.1 CoA transferase [Acidimicrobiaceae bacterium]
MSAPLEGVIVVALEAAVAAPFATRQLADLGARVLKVERPGEGDFARHYDSAMSGTSAFFVWANRGKQSIELDLKDPEDRARFDRLVAGADVFVQNLSPAAARRAGILADQLRADLPGLIACDISGYGLGGPRTDDKAYDLAVQAEGGAVALTGTPGQACKVGFSIADIAAAMYAFSSILAALYRRQAIGEGASIEVSMLESIAEWTAAPTYAAVGKGSVPPRAGHRHTIIAPYGMYPMSDGELVMIGVQSNRDWADFAEHVLCDPALSDDPRFADNSDRIANIDDLEALITSVFTSVSPEELMQRLRAGRVAHSFVRDPMALWQHDQLRARDRFMQVTTPTGSTEVYKPPFNLSDAGDPDTTVPALGEHALDLITELESRAERR